MSAPSLTSLVALLTLAGLGAPASGRAPERAQWTLSLESRPTTFRLPFVLRATVRLDPGWRLYSLTQPPGGPIATRIWLAEGQPWTLAGSIEGPEPVTEFDRAFGMDVEAHTGRAGFDIPVKRGDGPPEAPVQVKVRYQMCSGELCLRPKTITLELSIPPSDQPGP